MSKVYEPDRIVRPVGVAKYLVRSLHATMPCGQSMPEEPRRRVGPADFVDFPRPVTGKGIPNGWHDWYDWALVWRYWHGQADGLRRPYLLELAELMYLGRDLTGEQLAARLGRPERTICRWRARLAG